MSILKWQVNSSSKFASFFIVMTYNSSVNFKLIHFLLWTKGSYQSPNFETFEFSHENLPNSSCHFPKQKSVSFSILHQSSVSWKITPLYFFSTNIIYVGQKQHIKVQTFLDIRVLGSKFTKLCHFWNNISVFLQKLHHSSVSWDITLLYFFSWNFIYFQQKEPIKVQIWWNFTWAVESLKFCTLMGSFCPNHVQFQLKKYRRVISHDTEEWCKV